MHGTAARTSRLGVFALAMTFALTSAPLEASPRVALRDEPTRVIVPRGARYLIDVGPIAVTSVEARPELGALARSVVVGRLATEGTVLLGEPAVGRREIERVLRRHHLRGYFIDGCVRVTDSESASRVEVSLVVQTHPGREYRFESSVSVTLGGGDAAQRRASLASATRRAVLSATTRALAQLAVS
jgi:hypothetical protein